MREFDYAKSMQRTWDKSIVNYIGQIHECKGRQQLFLNQNPQQLDRLVDIAKIQSTEASNEIEGIVTTDSRLRQLMEDKTMPRNRDEKEILGYRHVLNTIHENYEFIMVRPNYILQMHKMLYQFLDSPIGGRYKDGQNEIIKVKQDGSTKRIFLPLAPFETPDAVQAICDEYNKLISESEVDPLLLIPVFIHDFLCIHPFNDGNGRMSRLLTTLLLYKSGYMVPKYISLEKKIQISRSEYYDALSESSQNWSEESNDDTPFVKYLLGVILASYRDFEDRVKIVSSKMDALEMVEAAVANTLGKFTKTRIMELCPSLGQSTVEVSLRKLCDQGKIEKQGAARATFYVRKTL